MIAMMHNLETLLEEKLEIIMTRAQANTIMIIIKVFSINNKNIA